MANRFVGLDRSADIICVLDWRSIDVSANATERGIRCELDRAIQNRGINWDSFNLFVYKNSLQFLLLFLRMVV